MRTRHLPPGCRWHRFGPDWQGHTAIIAGNGTSMLGRDLMPYQSETVHVMVTNGGWVYAVAADVLMCSDRHWLADHQAELRKFKGKEIVCTQPQALKHVDDKRLRFLRREFVEKVDAAHAWSDPGRLVEGHSSVTTCMSVAVLRGARKIILLGINLAPGPDNRRRATEEITDDPAAARIRYGRQKAWFDTFGAWLAPRGIEIVNCSPRSILTGFRYSTLEQEI